MKLLRVTERKMFIFFYLKALVLIFFIKYGVSVPVDYCLQPLNTDDCGREPTPVFSYYKPGSRCEIEMWRGCPTFNMFTNEFLCSHICIGKLWDRKSYNEIDFEEKKNECLVPINTEDCGIDGEYKYTYNGTSCEKVQWAGCPSDNAFDEEDTCIKTCYPSLKNELNKLDIDDAQAINSILDIALADNITGNNGILPLKLHKPDYETRTSESTTHVATTEAASETEESKSDTIKTTVEAIKAPSGAVETTNEAVVTEENEETTIGEATTQVAETETAVGATSEGDTPSSATETVEVNTETSVPDAVTVEPEITTVATTYHVGSVEEVLLPE